MFFFFLYYYFYQNKWFNIKEMKSSRRFDCNHHMALMALSYIILWYIKWNRYWNVPGKGKVIKYDGMKR